MTGDARAGAIVEYVVELVGFPGTKYDDQVDSTTQALDHMQEDDVLATAVVQMLEIGARKRSGA